MTYTIKLSTGVSSGAPSGTVYTYTASNFTFGSQNKDKRKALPSGTTLAVPLGKLSNTYKFTVYFADETAYNNGIETLLDWQTTKMYLWVYVNNTPIKIAYRSGATSTYAKTLLTSIAVTVDGQLFSIQINAMEVV